MDASRPLGLSPRPRKRKKYVTLAALLLLAAAGLVLAAMVATHPDDTVVLMRTGARVDTSYVAPDRNQPSHAGNLPPATR